MFKLDPIKVTCKGFTANFLINSGETCQTIWNAISKVRDNKLWVIIFWNYVYSGYIIGCDCCD